jgi:hypothetical protein
MKIRQSTKIAIGFVVLSGLGYGAYTAAINMAIANAHFAPVPPAEVNLVGIDTGGKYKIIVSNEIAQLVEASDTFGGDAAQGSGESGATEGAVKKRIPIKDLLLVLKGDSKALGDFVMTMNEMKEDNLPSIRVVWRADKIRQALNGDKALQAKLESDLVTRLDGSPLGKVRPSAIENGIVIEAPVTVSVNINGKITKVVGYVLDPFKTHLVTTVESRYADKNYNQNMQLGYYTQEARALVDDPKKREDVRQSLLDKISDQLAAQRVRRRLWKYSRDKVGTQILLVADGVAIAAPRIQHVLAEGELTITQMRDKPLVTDAVDRINPHAAPAEG